MNNQIEVYTLLILNIKEFSKINLLYGHDIGDSIIIQVFEYISKLINPLHMYRIYGDEFAIFSSNDRERI